MNKNIVLILALLLLFSDYNNLDYVCVCVYGTLYSAQDFIISYCSRSADLFLPCPEEAQCATLSRSWKGTVRQNRKAFILRIGWRTQSPPVVSVAEQKGKLARAYG